MNLPPRRTKPRSGIERAPKREWPRHQRFVRSRACAVPGCPNKAVCAHLRTAANSGKGLKPADWYTVPLCNAHHAEQEGRTESFGRKYGIDLWEIAATLAQYSPDVAMREVMRAAAADTTGADERA